MMYTKAMIKNKFTEIIREYINNGYNVEVLDAYWKTTNMIDLSKPAQGRHSDNDCSFEDYVRIQLNNKRTYDDYNDYRMSYSIEVSRYNNYSRDFEVFKTYKFMQLNNYKDFYTSSDDYDRIMQVRNQRLQNKFNDNFIIDKCINLNSVSVNMRNKIMNRIHNIRGMKSAKFDVVKLIHFHRSNDRLMCEIHWHDGCEKHGIIRIE